MKQTAVDFIVKELDILHRERKEKVIDAETFFNHKGVLIKEAKEMEKQQTEKMYSEADNIMKFLDAEIELKLSDEKTIKRIKWYFETYFEQFKKKH